MWSFDRPYSDRMNAISSTLPPRCGKISETSMPLSPWRWNSNGLGMSGPGCPWRTTTDSAIGWPAYFVSAGFGSKVSTWLTPPLMKSEMTAFARGSKCGCFGANGLPGIGSSQVSDCAVSAASRPCLSSMSASARPAMPPPDWNRKSRRDQNVFFRQWW